MFCIGLLGDLDVCSWGLCLFGRLASPCGSTTLLREPDENSIKLCKGLITCKSPKARTLNFKPLPESGTLNPTTLLEP